MPLVEPADAVVLGLDLDSEIEEEEGTSAFELLSLYTNAGRPVVALGSDPRIVRCSPTAWRRGSWGLRPVPQLVKAVRTTITEVAG